MWSQSDGTKELTFTQILWRMSTSTTCSIQIPTGLMTWYVESLDFFWNFSFASSTLFACMIVNYILNTVDLQKHGHNEDILSVAQCPPNLLATSGYDGEVIVWNMVSGHIFCHLSAPIPREYEDQSCMSIFFFFNFLWIYQYMYLEIIDLWKLFKSYCFMKWKGHGTWHLVLYITWQCLKLINIALISSDRYSISSDISVQWMEMSLIC